MDAPVTVDHPRDLLVGHGVSALCMAAMVAVVLPGWLTSAALGLFAVGLGWCGVQAVRRPARAAYLRLGLCCAAMLTMLVPQESSGHAGHAGQMSMAPGTTMTGDRSLLTDLLAAALVVVAVAGVVRLVQARDRRGSRLVAGCEPALAAAMAAMLLGVL
jgi:hypothetical protein